MIETLFYAALLAFLVFALVRFLLPLSASFRTVSSLSSTDASAQSALEKITRETKDAKSVHISGSVFDASPGDLILDTTDDAGNATTVEFFLSGTTLRQKLNGTDVGPLTSSTTRITNLVFRHIATAQSHAIRVEMTIEGGQGASYVTRSFYTTAVLRGSYPSS
jgi:hypothetical protein